ncbi:MAG: helix-turn-helix domain-containing protein, partial [Odoribacter sp.]|nr:helix-turn-helix domain-containing protein [Odoribacter sp.]
LNVSFTDMCGLESSPNDFSCTANERREIGIYENLKSRRLELGLTMREVAISLGVTEATISRYESGDIHNMGIDKLKSLAKILNCEPAYLMGLQNKPFRLSAYEETLVAVSRTLNNDGKQKLIERAETLHDLGYANEDNIKMA